MRDTYKGRELKGGNVQTVESALLRERGDYEVPNGSAVVGDEKGNQEDSDDLIDVPIGK